VEATEADLAGELKAIGTSDLLVSPSASLLSLVPIPMPKVCEVTEPGTTAVHRASMDCRRCSSCATLVAMADEPDDEDLALAVRLLAEWDDGRGVSKSQLEIKTWNDATSHGRRFDRFIGRTLGVTTNRPSKQTDRIGQLERQIRGLNRIPAGYTAPSWELELQHAREACLSALRVWNDPIDCFRTGGFSLMFVTAWNALAIASLELAGGEWRKISGGSVVRNADGVELARDTDELLGEAFAGDEHKGLRQNVQLWIDLRNGVAHRRLVALDALVTGEAQAGLLNFENALVSGFGAEYALGESLAVPLQLSGFRDPGVVRSRRLLLSSLPLDVQAILSRAESADPDLLRDPTYIMRVAFVPVVPNSGRGPDAVAYFVKPGDVPEELKEALDRYLVFTKPVGGARLLFADVEKEFERRVAFKLDSNAHAAAARSLGAWPPRGEASRTVNASLAEYSSPFKRYLYTQAWIDLLVTRLSTAEEFQAVVGRQPKAWGAASRRDSAAELPFSADPDS